MLLYKNTFENILTSNINFPIEDQYYANENTAIVADGITRDPIGIKDFSKCSKKDLIINYPNPSGAEMCAKEICKTFKEENGTLKEKLIKCNEAVNLLNKKYIKECDYLENDYYGAVASCIEIKEHILKFAYICDSGVIVYDKLGNIKFQTEDDKKIYSDPYKREAGLPPWYLSECRKIVRSKWRNNPDNIIDGKCVSFGAITGEKEAISFIKSGEIEIEKEDTVLLYSDGFSEFLHEQEFINKILDFNKEDFENYIVSKSTQDYEKYGKEKTIIIYKIDN